MTNIILPAGAEEGRKLSFYLALEEYVADNFGTGFFTWQVPPTVIIGRNQDLQAEVNIQFCRDNRIDIVRRKSGGGCVYSDSGNLMISYITRSGEVNLLFQEYLQQIRKALNELGLPAVTTSNNDVLVGGFKVSGNAFFVMPHASIIHGTMLFHSDFSMLEQAITPSVEKLGSHGVKSVRQRVANLRELGLTMDIGSFRTWISCRFCNSSRQLTPEELLCVEEIEKSYLEQSFILGKIR